MLHIVPGYADSPPDILKSNTETCFKIISGLWNNLQNHRRLPVCRNKQFERVTGRLFKTSKCFHRSKPKLYLFFSITRQQKNFKTILAHIKKVMTFKKLFISRHNPFKNQPPRSSQLNNSES